MRGTHYSIYAAIAIIMVMLASCNNDAKEYDEVRASHLADLHANPSDYTSSEIKEIEMQVELFAQQIEKRVDEIADATSQGERERATYKFILEFNDNPNLQTIGKLIKILESNDKADKAKIKSIQQRMISVYMLIEKEL